MPFFFLFWVEPFGCCTWEEKEGAGTGAFKKGPSLSAWLLIMAIRGFFKFVLDTNMTSKGGAGTCFKGSHCPIQTSETPNKRMPWRHKEQMKERMRIKA
jgi:hypothetical protein